MKVLQSTISYRSKDSMNLNPEDDMRVYIPGKLMFHTKMKILKNNKNVITRRSFKEIKQITKYENSFFH